MKLHAFVSESVNLSDLVPITEFSKISNKNNDITGLFSYNHGHYLQIIEGEDNKVDRLVKSIHSDNRHKNLNQILDIEIEKRMFSDWDMNLLPLLKHNESFNEFTNFLNTNINLLSNQQILAFNIFFKLTNTKPKKKKRVRRVSSLVYSISQWPNFEIVKPTSSLMSLCGLIMNNPKRFDELSKQHFYGTEEQLRSMLKELNKAGYLTVKMARRSKKTYQFDSRQQKQTNSHHWQSDDNQSTANFR